MHYHEALITKNERNTQVISGRNDHFRSRTNLTAISKKLGGSSFVLINKFDMTISVLTCLLFWMGSFPLRN